MTIKARAFAVPLWCAIVVFFGVFSLFPSPRQSSAQEQEKFRLSEVKVAGNIRVEEDGIRLHLKQRAGEFFDPSVVAQDIKSIYRMGFFDDVKAELSAGSVLIYTVIEKPYVREIKIQGNSKVGKDKIETALGITPRTILDRGKVSEGIEKVRKMYGDQGYVNAQVDYAISVEENNQAIVLVDVNEGNRLLIKRISIEGNRAFSGSDLTGLMATKEEWFLSFITSRGVLDRDVLTNDMAILAAHYYDHGYIDHKIGEPIIVRRRDGIEIVIRVEEGEQYRVGKVELGGDLIQDGQQMLKQVKITTGQIFRGSRLREDISTLTEMYTNKGFAFAQIDPLTKVNPEQRDVDIAFVINRGPPVYFNRILVSGNTKTRDKVVRRELTATEQELFSGSKITQSRNALQRTGYFEDVQLTTKKTEQPDSVDLLIDVKEGPTGTFSLGGGFSSGDGFIFNTSVAEKNLFGRGQGVNANFALGSTRQDFLVNFTEPYFRDSQLSLGVDAFNTERDFTEFSSRKTGFGVRTSYPLKHFSMPFFGRAKRDPRDETGSLTTDAPPSFWDYMRGGMNYEFTREKIGDIESTAPASIAEEKGTSMTSSLTPTLSYDSRDHFFTPTEGTKSAFSVKFAGLGGDNRFLKTDASARWHYSVLKDPNWGGTYTVALGGTLGFGVGLKDRPNGKKDLPIFERYFPGGINSVRGFAERSLGPKDGDDAVGGDRQAVLNAELMFPIMEQYGLRGVTFFDMGQAFRQSDSFNLSDFRRSVGVGARWLSPFGPLRVELGFPLNKKSGDDTSVIGFSLGGDQR